MRHLENDRGHYHRGMKRKQLSTISAVADKAGQLHSRLTELEDLDGAAADAVARAAALLDEADVLLTKLFLAESGEATGPVAAASV